MKEEELDSIARVENSGLVDKKHEEKVQKVKMMDEVSKQGLMDFIFGKTDVNPLEDKKENK